MSSRAKLAIAVIGVVAVVLGLILGRSCNGGPTVVDAGVKAVVVDAGQVVRAPVDAGQAQVAVVVDAGFVDAGEQIALVAPTDGHHRGGHAHDGTGTHEAHAAHEKPAPPPVKVAEAEPPKKEAAPEVHDAGPPPVVDAGVVAAKAVREDIKPEALPSAPITIAYTDQLSTWLKLTQVRIFVDGKRVADEHNDKGIDLTAARVLYEGAVFPGTHQVRVESVYFGKSNGLFSYMEGYRFRVPQMAVVQLPEGKKLRVDAVAYDKGALEQWENRPGMKLNVAVQ